MDHSSAASRTVAYRTSVNPLRYEHPTRCLAATREGVIQDTKPLMPRWELVFLFLGASSNLTRNLRRHQAIYLGDTRG